MLMAAALAAAQAAAQVVVPPSVDPGAIQRRQMEEEQRRRQEEQERAKPTPPINREGLRKPAERPADNTVRFLVREITFSPSKILGSAELEKAAAAFRGREVTLADLQQLTAAIDAAYRARRIVTAEALIPPQDVSQGVVHVRLIEGKVGRTAINGNGYTRTRYIENRLRLQPRELVDLDRLESAMVRFNRTNDAQVRASLKPGVEPGTSDFQIDVAEPRRDDLRLMLDNFGSPGTGRTRLTAAYLHRSLFGRKDDVSVSDTAAKGQNSSAIGYGMPVNTWGGRVDLGFNFDKTAIKNGGLESLRITGQSRAWTLSLRQPTLLSQRMQLDVIASAQKRDSTNWIDDVFLNDTRTRGESLCRSSGTRTTRSGAGPAPGPPRR
jgi:hemolysin activation/secretion protein